MLALTVAPSPSDVQMAPLIDSADAPPTVGPAMAPATMPATASQPRARHIVDLFFISVRSPAHEVRDNTSSDSRPPQIRDAGTCGRPRLVLKYPYFRVGLPTATPPD